MRVSSVHGVVAGILVILVGVVSAPTLPLRRAAGGAAATPGSGSHGFGVLLEVLRNDDAPAVAVGDDPGSAAAARSPALDSEAPVRAASDPEPASRSSERDVNAESTPRR